MSTLRENHPNLFTLTPQQVAQMLHVSEKTLERWRRTGQTNLAWVRVGGRPRYRPEDVEAFLVEYRKTSDLN
jgi:excisionase family DNA binding protein